MTTKHSDATWPGPRKTPNSWVDIVSDRLYPSMGNANACVRHCLEKCTTVIGDILLELEYQGGKVDSEKAMDGWKHASARVRRLLCVCALACRYILESSIDFFAVESLIKQNSRFGWVSSRPANVADAEMTIAFSHLLCSHLRLRRATSTGTPSARRS
jgi:hypothetical protein